MRAYWRELLDKQVGEARNVLGALLSDRFVFAPTTDAKGVPCYQIRATFALRWILSGIVRSQVARPQRDSRPVGCAELE